MSDRKRLRIEALFEAALSLAAEDRSAWLEAACGGDEDVRVEVESLLAAHDRPHGILDVDLRSGGSPTPVRSIPASPSDAAAGADVDGDGADGQVTLGPWRVVREIASGGMGIVYLAERADGQYQRQVAIKVIRGAFFTEEMHDRFTNERQILASLNHPNIARLFGGGRTERGRPYLVMEFVDGLPITEYCARRSPPLDNRLRLFCTAARAAHHAHQRLVVHRDIKPSNILVEPDGTPKLLDFGIAKVLDPTVNPASGPAATRTGVRLMTPEYASPEQVRGGPITTATDVYSLGVILYEILTGQRPFELRGGTLQELERRIMEDEPTRPSNVISRELAGSLSDLPAAAELPVDTRDLVPHLDVPALLAGLGLRRLRQQLRGDLDRIVLMALRKEPELRYPSAEALARDIERYLAGQPVSAQRSSRRYRAAKFIQRNRMETLLGTAAVFALVGGASVSAWQAHRAEEALAVSEAALARSEDVTGLLLEMFDAADPLLVGADTTAGRAILRRGMRRASELGDQPLVQAEMLHALGRINFRLGRYDESLEQFERALEVRVAELGPDHPDVAESLERVAWLRRQRGDLDVADTMLAEALSIQEAAYGSESVETVEVLRGMARLATTRGLLDSAGVLHRRVLAIETAAYGLDDPRLAYNLHRIAGNLRFRGHHDSALALYREALDLRQRGHGPEHPEVAQAMLHLADELQRGDTTDYAEAERLYKEALDMQRRLLGEDYPNLVHGLGGLADLANLRGRYEEADAYQREAMELRLRTHGPDNAVIGYAYHAYGLQRTLLGDWTGALRYFDMSRDLLLRHLGEGPDVATTYQASAEAWLELERPDSAMYDAREAVRIFRSTFGPDRRQVGEALAVLGRAEVAAGLYREAEADLLEARRIASLQPAADSAATADSDSLLARMYREWEREPG